MVSYNQISTIYVAPDGSDGNSGVASECGKYGTGPLRTVYQAVEKIRALRQKGVLQPITVRFAPGVYFMDRPLELDESVKNVTFEADTCADGAVVFSGGVRLEGFVPDEFMGRKCLSVKIPDAFRGQKFEDFIVNGLRADFTRYPAEGSLIAEKAEDAGPRHVDGGRWFIAAEGDVKNFRNMDDCIVSFLHYWIDEHTTIGSYDPETRRVELKVPSCYRIAPSNGSPKGMVYYLENVAETFGKPNEWYYDRPSGTIYYIPRENSMTPENITAYLPTVWQLVRIRGQREKAGQLRFRGIRFCNTRSDRPNAERAGMGQSANSLPGVIHLENVSWCAIEDCEIANVGYHAVAGENAVDNLRISNTVFRDCGAGAVKLNGSASPEDYANQTHDCLIEDCRITHCGRRHHASCGILIQHGHSISIVHNEISDLYYTGISAGWVWGYAPSVTRNIRIEKNHIHHIGQGLLSDMGGVYLLGSQPGTVVTGNLIHDVTSAHYGGWALYTDEGSSFITMENNVCYNTTSHAFHQHYGSMNVIRNNILAFGGQAQLYITRFEEHLSLILENNVFLSKGSPMMILDRKHYTTQTVGMSRNVFYSYTDEPVALISFRGSEKITDLAEMQESGFDDGSVVADPLFRDPLRYDFTLSGDSPAIQTGFVPIDISDVGPR